MDWRAQRAGIFLTAIIFILGTLLWSPASPVRVNPESRTPEMAPFADSESEAEAEGIFIAYPTSTLGERRDPTPSSSPITPGIPKIQPVPGENLPHLATAPIRLNSVVGLKCHFDASDPEDSSRASGVVVSSAGYVLTNRHLVDRVWTEKAYGKETEGSKELQKCYGRILDLTRTIDAEQASYPFFDLNFNPSNWDFELELAHLPDEDYSKLEYENLDFAVLKITKWNEAKFSNIARPKLGVSPIVLNSFPKTGDGLVSPGFAFQQIGVGAYDTFRLLTLNFSLTVAYSGDQTFLKDRFVYDVFTANPDVTGGRSGSPLFWKGYVAGLIVSKSTEDGRNYQAVGISPIYKDLVRAGKAQFIESSF